MGLCCRIAVFVPIIVVCFVIGLPLWFAGYHDRTEWNNDAVETLCTVTNNYVSERQCSYTCNCAHITAGTYCSTCYYTCYDGRIDATYTVDGTVYNEGFTPYSGDRNDDNVADKLVNNYPIGKQVICFYQSDDPSDAKLHKPNAQGYYIAAVFFIVLGCAVILGWGVFELINGLCN